MKRQQAPVITIDGASGTGKGAVTHQVAKKLDWNLLDSGALYRVLALAAEKNNISLTNEPALALLAQYFHVQFITKETSVPPCILLEGQEVTQIIRTEKVGNAASKLGVLPAVRQALISRQRVFCQPPGLVTDGRDMGTVIFPEAFLKIFLIASPEVRAKRRYKQLRESGIHVTLSGLLEELQERDKRDRERAVAPLKPAVDAICIDTDPLTIEQVVGKIMTEVKGIVGAV